MANVHIFILVGFAVAGFWFANAKPCFKSSSGPEEKDKINMSAGVTGASMPISIKEILSQVNWQLPT